MPTSSPRAGPTAAIGEQPSWPPDFVTVVYAGGGLWAGDVNGDAQFEALLIGASIKLTTGFTCDRSAP